MKRYEKKIDAGTVIDHMTGLEWQHDYFEYLLLDDDMGEKYARSQDTGGYTDWRMPTIKELISLVDYSRHSPASSFPGMPNKTFWSSSPNAVNPSLAWYVDFSDGLADYGGKGDTNYVRCVRRGPLEFRKP